MGYGELVETFAHTLLVPMFGCTLCDSVYTCSAVCSAVYNYLAPPWFKFCQEITGELRVFCFALIGPIDDGEEEGGGGEFSCVDHLSVNKGVVGKRIYSEVYFN